MKRFNKILFFFFGVFFLAGCVSTQEKQRYDAQATTELRVAATPKATPQRNITNFSQALKCMDTLFYRYDISDILVGAQDIPDQTEVVIAGTKDMLISALSSMSIKSGAIRFVALGQDLEDITRFHSLHKQRRFSSPDFFIRGAITQVDQGVLEKQSGAGLAAARYFSVEGTKDRLASIVGLDMSMGLVSNLQILPGTTSSNSIAVVRKGKGLDATGTIKKLGLLFFVDFTHSEGLHHAVRTLVELGAIEILGKLTQVPYWECLDLKTTNTYVQAQIEDWYNALDGESLTKFTQAKLKATGYYSGAIDGIDSEQLHRAVALYKSKNNLNANGELDYLLYYNLIADNTPISPDYLSTLSNRSSQNNPNTQSKRNDYKNKQKKVPSKIETAPTALTGPSVTPLDFTLTTSRGDQPVYRSGESAELKLNTSVDAHIYCFYKPADGSIMKIFPNRFRPDSKVIQKKAFVIPGDTQFEIRLDDKGEFEKILCMASYNDIEKNLPFELREKNLQPVSIKRLQTTFKRQVTSLEDIYQIYKNASDIVPLKKTITMEIQ